MKMSRKWLLVAALVLSVAMASTGTIAYLQDSDSDVNVMTMGSVYIEQIEQERDASGNLVEFTQGKPALPAVGPIEWAAKGVDVNGTEYKVFTKDLKNVVDKIVTVKNIGKSDAFVRTILAIEAPGFDPDGLIHINTNGDAVVTWSDWYEITINNIEYCMIVATYNEALAPNEISAPSLMQLFLDSKADNDDCAAFGATWEVLVVSQAVQADGFDNAKTALDTAFGVVSAASHPWIDVDDPSNPDDQDPDDVIIYSYASNAKELADVLKANGNIKLLNDITVTSDWAPIGSEDEPFTGVLDGAGYTVNFDVEVEGSFHLIDYMEGGTVKNLKADGEIVSTGYAAPFVFEMYDSVIENCTNNADITARRASGIGSWISGEVKDCVNNGNLNSELRAGGICGTFSGTMTNCVNTGDIINSGTEPAGGMVGVANAAASFKYCVNNGDVTTQANNPNASASGILGHSSSKITFDYCINTGDITANECHAAGIGYTLYGSDVSSYCYNSGAVYGKDSAGGIAPKSEYAKGGKANHCVNAGVVTGGTVYNVCYTATDSYYYDGADLYANNGTAADASEVLSVLNGGEDTDFFTIKEGKIIAEIN